MNKTKRIFFGGFFLALAVVLFVGAMIDYRALNSNQFTTSGTVSIVSQSPLTNPVFFGTSPRFSTDFLPVEDSGLELGWLQVLGDGKFQRSFNGSSLTDLSAAALATGTVPDARLPASSTTLTQINNNFTFVSNVTFSSTSSVAFHGKVTLNSNVFLSQLSFATNHAAVGVLNLNCTDQAFATNNNVAYTGFNIPAEYGVTNSAWATVLVTNDSALAFITITFNGCIGDTTIYVTNQSAFTVKKFPRFGTNVVANNLK